MNNIILILTCLVLISIAYKYIEGSRYEVEYVKSDVNGKEYIVRNLPDKKEAVNLIANLSITLKKLVDYCASLKSYKSLIKTHKLKSVNDNLNPDKFEKDIERMINNFNEDEFSESTPDAKYTSYAVNKGEKIVMCLRRKKEGNRLMDLNVLKFVALHELSHLMTYSIGHTDEFWDNFKLILKIAIDIGIYKHIDFNKKPVTYCGTQITDTPYKPNN